MLLREVGVNREIQIFMSEVEIGDRCVFLMIMLVFSWESILVELNFDVLSSVLATEVLLVF